MTDPTSAGTVPWPPEAAARYRAEHLWWDRNLFERLAEVADGRPDKVALIDGDRSITYAELVRRAETGSTRLLDLGLRPDDRIVVQLGNGWQFVVLLLACLRSGIIPVLALPAHRELEISAITAVAEARALVVPGGSDTFDHVALARKIAAGRDDLAWIIVSGDTPASDDLVGLDALLADGVGSDAVALPEAASPAFFLLSGGTTGLPKLITRTHNDYDYNMRACASVAGLTSDSVYLVSLPAGHNFALGCPGLLGTLLVGGTVVLLSSPRPERVFAAVAAHGVTIAAAVPAVAQRWIDHAREHGAAELATLQVLQVGGSRMPNDVAVHVDSVLGCRLQQVFGMAEGLINMTRLDDPAEVITTTQGRPVSDADEIRVVDAAGQDVPDGTRGSILTRGPYTPRGYYASPEANERSFIDGWYSSGDIVERRPDGNLIVHGRDKDLINRGGEKISAEEVESLTYRMPQVELAAAVAMPDPLLGERLCLYVVVRQGETLDLDDVRRAMAEAGIAAFKLSERLEIVDQIPMTKVGKINKAALRADIAGRLDPAGASA